MNKFIYITSTKRAYFSKSNENHFNLSVVFQIIHFWITEKFLFYYNAKKFTNPFIISSELSFMIYRADVIWTSIVHSLEYHERRIDSIANLKKTENKLVADANCKTIQGYIEFVELTSLKVFRLHSMLPKILSPTGSWLTTKMVGIILRIWCGNKYHFSCSMAMLISLNVMQSLSPNSQTPKTVRNDSKTWINNATSSVRSTSPSWC